MATGCVLVGGISRASMGIISSMSAKPRSFRCLLGDQARQHLTKSGGSPDTFELMLAASGGPRWIGLVGIDRALIRFLRSRRQSRLPLLGASSGAWRVAAMSCDESGAAYDELEYEYIHQRFEGKPTPQAVSQKCESYLSKIFTQERLNYAIESSPFHANFTTAIFPRELPTQRQIFTSLLGLPVLNAVDRNLMRVVFQRGLFSAGPHPKASPLAVHPSWDAYPTRQVTLTPRNFVPALLASGSIPFVLAGVSAIPGAGPGHHVDGGLLDYHFEVESEGPVLYPHFSHDPLPGWMDRFPPFRRLSRKARSNLCLIVPSEEQLAKYPGNFYPGRVDFKRFSNDERIRRWSITAAQNVEMERELTACLEADDLVRISEPL